MPEFLPETARTRLSRFLAPRPAPRVEDDLSNLRRRLLQYILDNQRRREQLRQRGISFDKGGES